MFEAGMQELDGVFVFAHLDDVKAIAPGQRNGVGLRIRFKDVLGRIGALGSVAHPAAERASR